MTLSPKRNPQPQLSNKPRNNPNFINQNQSSVEESRARIEVKDAGSGLTNGYRDLSHHSPSNVKDINQMHRAMLRYHGERHNYDKQGQIQQLRERSIDQEAYMQRTAPQTRVEAVTHSRAYKHSDFKKGGPQVDQLKEEHRISQFPSDIAYQHHQKMEAARKLSSSRVQYGTQKLRKLNGKDILSQAAFQKQKMDYDRSHQYELALNHVRQSPQIETVPRKSGYSKAPDKEVSPNSYATYMRSLNKYSQRRDFKVESPIYDRHAKYGDYVRDQIQKDTVAPRHNSTDPRTQRDPRILETPVKYHPPPRNHVQGSAPKEKPPSQRIQSYNNESFDVVRSHQARAGNINQIVDNNTSMRIFNRHNPVTDGMNAIPDHNQNAVKPYYGGTKTMYERNNSSNFNQRSILKTGMRHTGAQIINNSFDQPNPPQLNMTAQYPDMGSMSSRPHNPSYIMHSNGGAGGPTGVPQHQSHSSTQLHDLQNEREWQNKYSSIIHQQMNQGGLGSRRYQGMSQPQLQNRQMHNEMHTIDVAGMNNPYGNTPVGNKIIQKNAAILSPKPHRPSPQPQEMLNLSSAIDNSVKQFHMSNDTLRLAEDNEQRIRTYQSPVGVAYGVHT